MHDHGLTSHELELLNAVFLRNEWLERVVVFGSRAKGTARPNSDIDLCVKGSTDPLRLEALKMALDDLPLPYRIDVLAEDDIRHAPLRDHVKRVGVVLYQKT